MASKLPLPSVFILTSVHTMIALNSLALSMPFPIRPYQLSVLSLACSIKLPWMRIIRNAVRARN